MTKPDKRTQKGTAINGIFIFLILSGILSALVMGNMEAVTKACFDAAKTAVELAIGLVGVMALWLGLMKVVEKAGLLLVIARRLKPLMKMLFPEVPGEHPAMSAMIMNMAANIMGLGNAATPFGIKAMEELDRLNPNKGTATNAMCLFLAINTSSVTLLPMGVIAVRAGAGA
ncbi:MAG: spore maturation protein, partial [Desulfobacterales bacterium]|nr:spore maturation protein [Desulfobacterales bacterium]